MGIETKRIQVELPSGAGESRIISQIIIARDGSDGRWKINHDKNPQLPDGFSYASGGAYAGVIDRTTGSTTFWQLQGDELKRLSDEDQSVKGLLRQLRKGLQVERSQSPSPKAVHPVTNQASRVPRLPRNLDLQISHDDFVASLDDISDQGGNTFIDLKSPDGSITLQLHVSRNANGGLSLGQTSRFVVDGETIDAEVTSLPARDGGYRITAQGRTFYFYGGEDVKRYWVNLGYSDLLGPNPHSGEELRIAHAITHIKDDTGPIRELLQAEINKRPLPDNLRLAGSLPVKDVRSGKPFTLRDQGYHLVLPSELKRGNKPGEIVVAFFDVEKGNDHTTVLYGPQGFTREVKFSTDLGTQRSSVNLNGVPVFLNVKLSGKDIHVRLDPHSTQKVVHVPGEDVRADIANLRNNGGVLGVLNRFGNEETGSIPLDYDAHMTQARAQGFSPSSPKAFCTFANLGVATLAGMGVEWFFSGDEENGGYHTRAEVGFWRHVATALATGLTSTLFSNGRISMTQALESYASGMLTSLPIDFGFNAVGLGSSPFGFALSYVANHFGDHVLEAVSKINPFARSVVTTAGLALFLGSTIYSYTTETRQNDARQSGMV